MKFPLLIKTLIASLLFTLTACTTYGTSSTRQFTEDVLFITHVTVLPLDGERELVDHTVIIVDGAIASITPAAKMVVPAGAKVLDGAGRYLMPGLSDLHAHLPTADDGLSIPDYLRLQLAAGVTTLRSMRGSLDHPRLREQVQRGALLGPQLFLASVPVSQREPLSAAQADALVLEAKDSGFDFIKLLWLADQHSYENLMAAAAAHEFPVAGHVPSAVSIALAASSGQASVEHLNGILSALNNSEDDAQEVAQLLADAKQLQVPTMFWYAVGQGAYSRAVLESLEGLEYVNEKTQDQWQRDLNEDAPKSGMDSTRIQQRLTSLKLLHDAGARLGIGADASGEFGVPGSTVHEEMMLFALAGIPAYDILEAATERALIAEGEIRVGQPANLVLLAKNPLDDIANIRSVVGVVLNGVWHTREAILAGM